MGGACSASGHCNASSAATLWPASLIQAASAALKAEALAGTLPLTSRHLWEPATSFFAYGARTSAALSSLAPRRRQPSGEPRHRQRLRRPGRKEDRRSPLKGEKYLQPTGPASEERPTTCGTEGRKGSPQETLVGEHCHRLPLSASRLPPPRISTKKAVALSQASSWAEAGLPHGLKQA